MTRRRRVAVSSDGTVWATHGGGGLLIYRTDGLEKRMSKRNGTFPAAELGPWALDGAGRAWIATDDGLVVVQPNGELTHLKQGTIPHLSGRVRAVIASGRPSLPQVAPERAVGSVRGRVTFDDADETGAPAKPEALTVHACGRIDWGGMGCPETKTWRRVAPVSADGAFEIAQVPVGPFALELFAGAERLQGSPRTSQRIARAGGVADVGTSSCSKRTSGTWWCRDLKPRASAATKRPGKKRTKRNKRVSQAPDGAFEVASDVLANVESRVRLVPHYRDGKQQGIKLVGVRPSSILRELSIRSGDVLLAMDGIPVGKLSSDELTAWLREAAGRERFSLSLTRGGLPIELTVLVRPPSVAPVSP